MRIAVICTANVCRSPLGAALLARYLQGTTAKIESAGTHADMGSPADPVMIDLAKSRGIETLATHHSRPVSGTLLSTFELVLCMESMHVNFLRSVAPTRVGAYKLLGHWGVGEISDPYRRSAAEYAVALDMIDEAAQQWATKLKTLGMVC